MKLLTVQFDAPGDGVNRHSCQTEVQEAPIPHRSVIVSDPEIMGGTPCFVGTRGPADSLIDCPEAGDSLAEFLDNFPSVSREAAIAALEEAFARSNHRRTQARLTRNLADLLEGESAAAEGVASALREKALQP